MMRRRISHPALHYRKNNHNKERCHLLLRAIHCRMIRRMMRKCPAAAIIMRKASIGVFVICSTQSSSRRISGITELIGVVLVTRLYRHRIFRHSLHMCYCISLHLRPHCSLVTDLSRRALIQFICHDIPQDYIRRLFTNAV
jgi:hypothetical protein